jgi:diguanylate cyclase (GGDEF)-like protein
MAPASVVDAQLTRRLEWARLVALGGLLALAICCGWLLLDDGISPFDVAFVVGLVALVLALYVVSVTGAALTRERIEREAAIRRVASGLSRSLSPESVVDTVISDLRAATDADHVVVARVSQPDQHVEVTLVAARADAPPSRTTLRPEIDGSGALAAAGDDGVGESAGGSTGAASAAAEEIARRVRSAYGLAHTLATPLVAERRFLGALLLARRGRGAWSEGDRRLLAWAASEVATAFARAYALEAAERGAKIDVLTGLPNRRYFDEALSMERPRRRANDSLGILMIDIDHFKILNDRFGHATGDRVLRAVAGAIAQGVRAEDTPARYGGEEFAVLLPICHLDEAMEVIERLRAATPEGQTVSAGVAEWNGYEGEEALIDRADLALYNAKRAGRDRTTAAA